MEKMFNVKSKLAKALAVVMAVTMTVPGVPARAADYGDLVTIQFDPGDGPGLNHSTYKEVAQGEAMDGNVFKAKGYAGHPLTDSADFKNLPTEDRESKRRPLLPAFDIDWPGYKFEGWYKEDGRPADHLPYVFPYTDKSTYTAVWKGRDANPYTFTVEHYRDFNQTRDAAMDRNGWPSDYDNDPDLRNFFKNSWSTGKLTANTPVSATYRRDIPGYKLESVLIKNNRVRKYDEASGEGTVEKGGADINTTTHTVRGSMPNDDLTVAYRYEPDPDKKFLLKVNYVDEKGVQVQPSTSESHCVEDEYTLKPPDIPNYELLSASLTDGGKDNLDERGIVSAGTAGCKIKDTKITGNMPNQAITFTYVYQVNGPEETNLWIRYVNESGEEIKKPVEMKNMKPDEKVTLPLEDIRGYKYSRLQGDTGLVIGDLDETAKTYTVTLKQGGGTVTVAYRPDYDNDEYWAEVKFYHGQKGTIEGEYTNPKYISKSQPQSLADITQGLIPRPDDHYIFDGWYIATSDGTGKTGNRLKDDTMISTKTWLYADFEEKPGEWFDLTFKSGAHGSIDGNEEIHTAKGTPWNSLIRPEPHPCNNYMFAGWYDEEGNKVNDKMSIFSDQIYTARFVLRGWADDEKLTRPDAEGSIGTGGVGQVSVSGANENRRYALTDMQDTVIDTKTGVELEGDGCFNDLNLCAEYYVYELSMPENPPKGSRMRVDPNARSVPALVTVPALGDNWRVTEDTDKTMKVTVSPPYDNTLYAILDTEGNVLDTQDADEKGWVTPSGAPLKAEFGGLKANRVYVVVAKHEGEKTEAKSKLLMGTEVPVTGECETERDYTIELTNGGKITKIKRGKEDVPLENDDTKAIVKEGDRISISPEEIAEDRSFVRWECLIGGELLDDKKFPDPEFRHPEIKMPAGNLVLRACYTEASPSNASIEYTTSKDSAAVPNLTEEVKKDLFNELANDEDQDAMGKGMGVSYIIGLNRRLPNASESNAFKAPEAAGEDAKAPWILTSKLARHVGGNNKDIPDGVNITSEIPMFYDIGSAVRAYLDYHLWEAADSGGTMTCTPVPMDPDPNTSDSGFTGLITFDAKVGSAYILTYMQAHKVTIRDDKRHKSYEITVKADTALEDADGFSALDVSDYTDRKGVVWEYKGLAKTEKTEPEYDTSEPVTKDLRLHVLYRKADDTAWRNALQKLWEEIDAAWGLENNGLVSDEDKERLREAIDTARKVAEQEQRGRRPTVEELTDAYRVLKELVDEISSGGYHPTPPDPNGGGGGGGGGGGASVRFRGTGYSYNGYMTYYNGSDGSWETAGENDDRWIFVLKGGQRIKNKWINVKNGDTQKLATYHLNEDGIMDTGWYQDSAGQWYYLDPRQGSLQFGWHLDAETSKWYYLNQFTGGMLTGWQNLGDAWYFLNPAGQAGQPLGSLYTAGLTPDGYPVDNNGRWIRETP